MPAVSLTGQDTVQIDGIIFQTLADQSPFDVTFPEDLGMVKIGKNGNAIYAQNQQGQKADINLLVLLGGIDDKYMNGRLQQWITDPSTFTLLVAMFVKRVGDGQGNIESKIYNCTGGFFKRQVDAKTSSEGDTAQSVATYRLSFSNCQVSIQ